MEAIEIFIIDCEWQLRLRGVPDTIDKLLDDLMEDVKISDHATCERLKSILTESCGCITWTTTTAATIEVDLEASPFEMKQAEQHFILFINSEITLEAVKEKKKHIYMLDLSMVAFGIEYLANSIF